MRFKFKDGKEVLVKWHSSFKRGYHDAVLGLKPRLDYKHTKRQQEYNKGYSFGTKARNHAYAQRLSDLFARR